MVAKSGPIKLVLHQVAVLSKSLKGKSVVLHLHEGLELRTH